MLDMIEDYLEQLWLKDLENNETNLSLDEYIYYYTHYTYEGCSIY